MYLHQIQITASNTNIELLRMSLEILNSSLPYTTLFKKKTERVGKMIYILLLLGKMFKTGSKKERKAVLQTSVLNRKCKWEIYSLFLDLPLSRENLRKNTSNFSQFCKLFRLI